MISALKHASAQVRTCQHLVCECTALSAYKSRHASHMQFHIQMLTDPIGDIPLASLLLRCSGPREY